MLSPDTYLGSLAHCPRCGVAWGKIHDPGCFDEIGNETGSMTPEELHSARATLGKLWGKDRPLHASELGRALRLGGRDPGESIRDYERGKTAISGPLSVAVEMMLAGMLPPDGVP